MAKKFDIERKIIDSFKLFEGLREPSEDQKILKKVLAICKLDIELFLAQNLTDKETKKFVKDTKDLGVEKALPKVMAKIPMGRFRLEERLKYTVDMTLAKALAER